MGAVEPCGPDCLRGSSLSPRTDCIGQIVLSLCFDGEAWDLVYWPAEGDSPPPLGNNYSRYVVNS